MLLLSLIACKHEPPPLGMKLERGDQVYAGAAAIDLTPEILETFTDLDGNHDFNGCLDRPDGTDCPDGNEPFQDVDGDGWFDATFIGGYGPMRPANGVHDAVWARAVVISQDEQYVAFVGLDLVGLGWPRIHEARDALAADGFDGSRLVVSSTHNHQGPDTMGLWGNPYDFAHPISGTNPEFQQRVADSIEQAVRDAAGSMVAVDLTVGAVNMRDRGPWFSGPAFGGKNPDAHMHGMIHDGRDPVVVSDQVLVVQGVSPDSGTVFTFTNWSGHPEVRGSGNNDISSDWVGAMRDVLEAEYGGIALHMPESLGGMQSALNGDIPRVTASGEHVLSGEVDADGDDVPVWAERDSWDFVTSHGWHLAEAAMDALADGETMKAAPIRVEVEPIYVPIENVAYNLLGPSGIFDLGFDQLVTDPALCPELGVSTESGCIPTQTSRVQLGPIQWLAVPGELLPELAWGFPDDDPLWGEQVGTLSSRGDGARYFPQHPRACDDVDYADCVPTDAVGDCDCLRMHASPYALSFDAAQQPMFAAVDSPYKAAFSMADNYMSYIVPEPDFNRHVSLLTDDGDHYEDTVSPAHNFGTKVLEGQARIAARWDQ